MNNQAFKMTDEIERQLMLAALQDQFRPRPLVTLAGLVKRLVSAVRSRSATLQPQSV